MTANLDIQVRHMQGSEIGTVLGWTVKKGRGAYADTADLWKAVDSSGLLLGVVDGKPAGAVAALRYSRSFGFIGLHVVQRGYEDSGVGQALWLSAMKHLHGRRVGIDAGSDQRNECAQYGFSLSYRTMRYQGRAGAGKRADGIVALNKLELSKVRAYDETVFPASRAALLRHWMGHKGGGALGIVLDGQCAGYGVIREGKQGWQAGPVYAASPELAEGLLLALKAWPPEGRPVYLDVPEANPPALAIAKRLGMRKVGERYRMFAGGEPRVAVEDWYGVCDGLG